MMSRKLLENRLIAFLDILGFSAFLHQESLENVHSKYAKFIDIAKNRVFFTTEGDNTGRTNFEYAEFISDSIVLVSNPIDDVYNVNNFIGAVSFLFEIGFISKMPLRGAISKGDFLLDIERNIFISREFSDIVHFEGQQEWSGCAILKKAEDIVLDAAFGKVKKENLKAEQIGNNIVLFYDVPLKNDKTIELLVVNYLIFLSKQQIDGAIEHLIEPKKSNNQQYFMYLNTRTFQFQKLSPEFEPAKNVLVVATRSGMRVIFLDENGNICKPGVEQFSWVAWGRWRE